MKLSEKVLISLTLVLFLLQLIPPFPGQLILFGLSVVALSLTYAIGGFWFFNHGGERRRFVPIAAGIAFCAALITLPASLRLSQSTAFKVLPALNILLFAGLGILLITKRKQFSNYKPILWRSGVILGITAFFSYSPVSFDFFRQVIKAVNPQNPHLVHNMEMFDYRENYQEAYGQGDCDRAIEYAEKSVAAGRKWLGISDEDQEKAESLRSMLEEMQQQSKEVTPDVADLADHLSGKSELFKISGTYAALYKSYKCKGDELYDQQRWQDALEHYLNAYQALKACEHPDNYDQQEEPWVLNDLALCYHKLAQHTTADSLFNSAIKVYVEAKDTTDRHVSYFLSNIAKSMSAQLYYGYSNYFYRAALNILQSDSANPDHRSGFMTCYHGLIKNHLQTDSLNHALSISKKALNISTEYSRDICKTQLLRGMVLYKMSRYSEAKKHLEESLDCFREIYDPKATELTPNLLALGLVEEALANYTKAYEYLKEGKNITAAKTGRESSNYAQFLGALAHLNKQLGDYQQSSEQYRTALKIFSENPENAHFSQTLSGIADLEIILADYQNAKAHSDSAMAVASKYVEINSPSSGSLLNNAAYVNYAVGQLQIADTLYQKTLSVNADFGMLLTTPQANALNGYGLVLTAQGKLSSADSAFQESLHLHQNIFGDQHPLTAVVYLNQANLKIAQNKLVEAESLLKKALSINQKYLDGDHDTFGDIYLALGDIKSKSSDISAARSYFEKTLSIFISKFGSEHPKVKIARQRLTQV